MFLLGCAPLDYITYYTPNWWIVNRESTNLVYFLWFVELHKTGGGFCALCHPRRIQAESGQFGCPDFLYHKGSKEVRYGSAICNRRIYGLQLPDVRH